LEEQAINKAILDEVGPWTLLKHDIVQYYAETYSNVIEAHRKKNAAFHLERFYIDGYASAGHTIDKTTKKIVEGSALRVLNHVTPPFQSYFFVEKDHKRFEALEKACAGRSEVQLFEGDANDVLPRDVFPRVRHAERERAFCLLDPYHEADLSWNTVKAAADTGAIDVLIHFPIYSMNINVFRRAGPKDEERVNLYWGDSSWKTIAYEEDFQPNFLGEEWRNKVDNATIVNAYLKRLVDVAGFKGTSPPIPMRNRPGNVIYYLIFASCNAPTGVRVVNDVASHFIKLNEPKKPRKRK
jgi:three-Cys-motif partner protein